MTQDADEISSVESWDDHIDNWTEFCKELKGELPKFQTLRRRQLAEAKLRMLIAKLDDEFDRAIVQLDEQDMEGYIAGGGEDAWTGFLSTARRLGKKIPRKDGEVGKLTNATARVQHMERSKEMVSIFNSIVRSHDKQLKGAVLTLTKQQMDQIVRKNHEKFSGTHKQRDQGKQNGSSGQATPKNLDHAFVTPRVKSAAKSRQAVSLLNKIVSEKDSLLKNAIQNMERKEKTLLTSKNNDFLKFEAQRIKQREEFRQAKITKAVADHPHATMRVRQEARAKTTLEKLKETVQKRSKALATSVKRIPKSQRDNFVRKVNGVTKDKLIITEKSLSLPAPSKQKKNLDTTRYARAEVMGLSRRVKADVQRAIEVKDEELEKQIATMDEEELRVLADFGPNGMEDINLWKRDRKKQSWRRLSAFGMVRNDPKLYRRWKQQRHQQIASKSQGREPGSRGQGALLGTTCATDIARRQPWSTDLHYTHRCRAQQKQITANPEEEEHGLAWNRGAHATEEATASSGRTSRKCVHTAPSSRNPAGRATPSRPASAPLGPTNRFEQRSRHRSEATMTPRLANLARVFYQSSVTSGTASLPGEPSSNRRHAGDATALDCPAQATGECPGKEHSEVASGPETHEHGAGDTPQERGTEDTNHGNQNNSDLSGAEKRMESVRLLWAVSQLSADAVTKKIMHGYSERQRAREPNRRPQPPASHCNATIAGRRKRKNISAGRRVVG